MRQPTLVFMVTLLLVQPASAAPREPVKEARWGTAVARLGQKAQGFLPVASGADGSTELPITVVHGAKPGPTLAVLAGTHGAEYVPILTLQALAPELDPARLSDTVLLVHAANPPAFFRRTVYYNPVDWKNLNRVFPGRAEGSLTERIAHTLTTEVIERSDFLVDVHCGDANEALRPYVAYVADAPDPAVSARARNMALHFGIDYIKANRHPDRKLEATVYTSDTAAVRGKPAIGVELGGLGAVRPEQVAKVKQGLLNVLTHLGMLPGEVAPVQSPLYVVRSQTVRSTATGLFFPEVEAGHTVAQGARLGTVRDFFGKVLAEPSAPLTGVVMYITSTPPISEGEAVASLGAVSESAEAPRSGGM